MFGDSNGQIKLHAKQKYKFLSATHYKQTDIALTDIINRLFVMWDDKLWETPLSLFIGTKMDWKPVSWGCISAERKDASQQVFWIWH